MFLEDIENIDLKSLNRAELDELSSEIRSFLVENISKTGGHLSPNLGVVELTLAIHKVFDTAKDRVVFDVGHQSYVHKILTGRKDKFNTLRQKDGLSGFTKPEESIHDASISGHASVSISTALGMAHARSISGEKHNVIAVIGDGALTGGLAYEALNNAGQSKESLIVILNDNEMSINKNVGAVSTHLSMLRLDSKYLKTKKTVHDILGQNDKTGKIDNVISKYKKKVKLALLENSIFEQMGFTYIGLIDGHNINDLCEVLTRAKKLKKPVLIHVLTKKGKGYSFSEKNPDIYHGISKFNVETGKTLTSLEHSFSQNFGNTMMRVAATNDKVCAITAAMSSSVGLSSFAKVFDKRFFDVGIAESHAVAMSAGLSSSGYTPVCAIYSTFLQRAYDQLIHDVAIPNLHVVFAVDRAGIVGDDGETHNGVFDVPMALSIPNFTIFAPSNYKEQENMLKTAINNMNSPVIVRYPRGVQGEFLEDTSKNDFKVYNEDGKVTIITYGILVNNVFNLLEKSDIKLIKINKLTMDLEQLVPHVTEKVIILEDCINVGCFGQKFASYMSLNSKTIDFLKLVNLGDRFTKQATVSEVYGDCLLSKEGIMKHIEEALSFE